MAEQRYSRGKSANKGTGRSSNKGANKGSSYYTYGNVAYDYDVQPKQIPTYVDDEERQRRIAEEKERKAILRENRVISLKFVAIILVLFAGCIAFMGMHVKVANADVALRRAKSELTDLRASNAIVQAEITEQLDMEYIKNEATSRLGMAEPQPYQIVYIDVPRQSYTVQYAADTAESGEEESLLDKIKNQFNKD